MLKLLSLFSGIGAFEKALDNLEVPYELTAFCEFDKYAVKSYCAIHNTDESKNLGDITKVDETKLPKDLDILTYGFPCQDISLAGKQKGLFNEDGTQTRSGLFFEALRIIEATKPKIAIAENVKNLLSKKFNAQFQVVLASLEHAGYNNYYQVLNAKDYGVPQNRERVFIVSIRKDIDTGIFEFPEAFPLDKRLKDVLEEVVDEKYYLSIDQMRSIVNWNAQQKPFERVLGNGSISPTLTARGAGENHSGMIIYSPENEETRNMQTEVKDKVKQVGQIYPNGGTQWYQQDRVYDGDKIAISVTTVSNPYYTVDEPLAYDEQNGYIRKDGTVGTIMTDGSSPKKNNRVIEPIGVWNGFNQRVRADSTTVGTLTQNCGADLKRNGQGIIEKSEPIVIGRTIMSTDYKQPMQIVEPTLRIRKLTPKECFRLMGFDDESFHKAEAVNSNTQLYKQAGNSIVVDVLEELFCQLLDEDGNIYV